jgi:hypothetical protein
MKDVAHAVVGALHSIAKDRRDLGHGPYPDNTFNGQVRLVRQGTRKVILHRSASDLLRY